MKNRLKTSCTTRLIHFVFARSRHSSRKRLKDMGFHLPATLKRKAKSTKSVAKPPRTESSKILQPSVCVAVETKSFMARKDLSWLLALPAVQLSGCHGGKQYPEFRGPKADKDNRGKTTRCLLRACCRNREWERSSEGRGDFSTNPNKQFTSMRTQHADMQRGRLSWYLPLSSW